MSDAVEAAQVWLKSGYGSILTRGIVSDLLRHINPLRQRIAELEALQPREWRIGDRARCFDEIVTLENHDTEADGGGWWVRTDDGRTYYAHGPTPGDLTPLEEPAPLSEKEWIANRCRELVAEGKISGGYIEREARRDWHFHSQRRDKRVVPAEPETTDLTVTLGKARVDIDWLKQRLAAVEAKLAKVDDYQIRLGMRGGKNAEQLQAIENRLDEIAEWIGEQKQQSRPRRFTCAADAMQEML